MSPTAVPPLEQRRQPGLSETLTGPNTPSACRSCGGHKDLVRWQEHDAQDQPLPILIVLCQRCSNRLIEPHHRLYRGLMPGEPWKGCMGICVKCSHRIGLTCAHPDVATLKLEIEPPARAILCRGRKAGGCTSATIYGKPATGCTGRRVLAPPQG